MTKLTLIFLLVAAIPAGTMSCPMAGKTYQIKHRTYQKAVLEIDPKCSELTVTFRKKTYSLPMTESNGGWRAPERDGYWFFKANSRSVSMIGEGWRQNMRLVELN